MSTLERIVPPLELCKQIPAGEFEDSALVWVVKGNEKECAPRTMFNAIPNSWKVFPAPTLEEIITKLPHKYKDGRFSVGDNYIEYDTYDGFLVDGTDFCSEPEGFAAAAIRLWFMVNGSEVE